MAAKTENTTATQTASTSTQSAPVSDASVTDKQAKDIFAEYRKTGTVRRGYVIDFTVPGNVRRR